MKKPSTTKKNRISKKKSYRNNNNIIKFAKMKPDAIIPTKRDEDGAFDIYALFDGDHMIIKPSETVMIPTGLASSFSKDYVAILKERGSTGTKGIAQRAGVIDSGYRGEWIVPITNTTSKPIIIVKDLTPSVISIINELDPIVYPYEKAICQCIMVEVPKLHIQEVSLNEVLKVKSKRGTGKLGSSGK